MNKLKPVKLTGIGLLLLAMFFLVHQKAGEVYAQACTVPAQVPNVAITFPSCNGSNCDFTQGSCSWGSVTDATGYQVTITEVETSRTIQSQQVASTVSTNTFPVAESNTYRCDVTASNSCGSGQAGTASLLCKVDAAVTSTPAATVPPATPAPKLPVTGSNTPLFLLAGSALIIVAMGGVLLLI